MGRKTRAIGKRKEIIPGLASARIISKHRISTELVYLRTQEDSPVAEEHDRPNGVYVSRTVRSHVNESAALVDEILLALTSIKKQQGPRVNRGRWWWWLVYVENTREGRHEEVQWYQSSRVQPREPRAESTHSR